MTERAIGSRRAVVSGGVKHKLGKQKAEMLWAVG